VVTSDASLGFSYTTYASPSRAQYATVSVGPSVDVFVIRNLSIGGTAFGSYRHSRGYGADGSLVRTDSTSFGGGVRIGYAIPLGRLLTLFPVVTLGVESLRTERTIVEGSTLSIGGNPLGVPKSSQEGPYGTIYLPLLLHPKPSFFVGFGPTAFHELAAVQGVEGAIGQRTTVGARAVVGGTFGGPTDANDPEPSEAPAPARRFGQQLQWVLTGELYAGFGSQTYSGNDSSSSSYTVTPSVDFFFADHMAIGVSASVSSTNSVSHRPDGSTVTYDGSSVGIGPRFGVEIPFGTRLSLFPRVRVGVAYEETRLTMRGASPSVRNPTNGSEDTVTFVGLSVPLLVHAAPHFFVGWGPWVYQELSRRTEGSTVQITGTSIGGSFFIGGWL